MHAAVEILFLLHAAFCVAFSVGYVYNLNNIKIVMSASFEIVDVLYIHLFCGDLTIRSRMTSTSIIYYIYITVLIMVDTDRLACA